MFKVNERIPNVSNSTDPISYRCLDLYDAPQTFCIVIQFLKSLCEKITLPRIFNNLSNTVVISGLSISHEYNTVSNSLIVKI